MIKMKTMKISVNDYVCIDDDATEEQIAAAVDKRIKAIAEAIVSDGLDPDDCAVEYGEVTDVDAVCPHCGRPVTASPLGQYLFACRDCDEDFFLFECPRSKE